MYIGNRRYDFLRSSKLINDYSLRDIKDFEGAQAAQNLVATGCEIKFVSIELLPLSISIMSEALLHIDIIDRRPLIDWAHHQPVALLVYLDVNTAKHFLWLYNISRLRLVQSVCHFLTHKVHQIPWMIYLAVNLPSPDSVISKSRSEEGFLVILRKVDAVALLAEVVGEQRTLQVWCTIDVLTIYQ